MTSSFRIHLLRPLKRAGLGGQFAIVTASTDGLSIKGEKDGSLTLPWAHIEHGRVGYTETKHGRIYEARLWSGANGPMRLFPYSPTDRAGYGDAMRMLARSFVDRGKGACIELGVSKFEALLAPVLLGIVVIACILAAAFAMDPPQWWHFLVIPAIPAIILAVLIWRAATVHWPRPLGNISDIERQLPR